MKSLNVVTYCLPHKVEDVLASWSYVQLIGSAKGNITYNASNGDPTCLDRISGYP